MKSVVVGVRLSKKVKDKLQQLADDEHRSLSNFISKILLDYLRDRGIEGKGKKRQGAGGALAGRAVVVAAATAVVTPIAADRGVIRRHRRVPVHLLHHLLSPLPLDGC